MNVGPQKLSPNFVFIITWRVQEINKEGPGEGGGLPNNAINLGY